MPDYAKRSWKNATKGHPCPVCEKPDWCSYTEDGDFAFCRRLGIHQIFGVGHDKKDKNGDPGWVYGLRARSGSPWEKPSCSHRDANGKIADPDSLHAVYSMLFELLPLYEHHKELLRNRGLTKEEHLKEYRSLGKERAKVAYEIAKYRGLERLLPGVPGFYVKEGEKSSYWSLSGQGGILIPCRDAQGRIIRVQNRPDTSDDGKYKWLSSKKFGGVGPGVKCHVSLFEGDKSTIRVTEGLLKANIATAIGDILTIATPSVGAFGGIYDVIRELKPKVVRLAPDGDCRTNLVVALSLKRMADTLAKEPGIELELEQWDPADGKGIDDILQAAKATYIVKGHRNIETAINVIVLGARAAQSASGNGSDNNRPKDRQSDGGNANSSLPMIVTTEQHMREVTAELVDAVSRANSPPTIFEMGTDIVRIEEEQKTKAPFAHVLNVHEVRALAGRVANFVTASESGEKIEYTPTDPPLANVHDYMAIRERNLPRLNYITPCPIFTESGELVLTKGHHRESGIYYHERTPLVMPELPLNPTRDDVKNAVSIIDDMVVDWPFADDASKTNAIAMFLEPLVRPMIEGTTPFKLCSAPTPGTGKTLMFRALTRATSGRDLEATPAKTSEDEWRKWITATLMELPAHILIDNVNFLLDSQSLAAVSTTPIWKDRVLQVSKTIRTVNSANWMFSANNPRLSKELARRCIYIRLDSLMDDPENRTGFRHPHILKWTDENRGQLLWAGLVLCQAWIAAGRPPGKETMGSFESWAYVMGGILGNAGIEGLITNANKLRSDTADKDDELREFVKEWWDMFGGKVVGVFELFAMAQNKELLNSVFVGRDGSIKVERSARTSLGCLLKKLTGRMFGRFRIGEVEDDHSGRRQYQLMMLEKGSPPASPPGKGPSAPKQKERADANDDEEPGEW